MRRGAGRLRQRARVRHLRHGRGVRLGQPLRAVLAEQLRDRLGSSVVLLGSEAEGKAQLVLTVSKPLTERFKAGNLIRPIAEMVGGSGGGRPDMAQAGGTQLDKLDEALGSLYNAVEQSA